MPEFEMSHAKQIAVELWGGNKETWEMETADVYQKLARGIISTTVSLEASVTEGARDNVRVVSPNSVAAYTGFARNRANHLAHYTLDMVAYEIANRAQLADAAAESEDDRYAQLNELADIYRVLSFDS